MKKSILFTNYDDSRKYGNENVTLSYTQTNQNNVGDIHSRKAEFQDFKGKIDGKYKSQAIPQSHMRNTIDIQPMSSYTSKTATNPPHSMAYTLKDGFYYTNNNIQNQKSTDDGVLGHTNASKNYKVDPQLLHKTTNNVIFNFF